MKAYLTSIGETTTELCEWSLKRQGFDVVLLQSKTSLWDKLKAIFEDADDDFLRVDADVVVNKNVVDLVKQKDLWWYQALTYDWYKQDSTHGGVQFIRKPAIEAVRKHIDEARRLNRPESYLYRLREFHEPRVCGTYEAICGLNGYKQTDMQRVKNTKSDRGQYSNYDWLLAERLNAL